MKLLPTLPGEGAPISAFAGPLADLGRLTGAFKLFRCEPGGKDPVFGEMWKESASNDRAVVEARWAERPDCNIGLAIQSGFIAIDADIYKPGHEEELDRFEQEHGELPRTLEFRSARGGLHLIYSTGRSLGNGRGTLPDFGDVRGHGGYLVGPGSTFEGKRYTIERISPPVALPAAVDQRLMERRSAPPNAKELAPFVMLDDATNIERFIRWLRHDAKLSIEGEHGNDTLAQTGAMGSSFGLSWDVTLGLLLEHWNGRCLPPWDDDDLEKHGGSGYRSATSKFGNMASKNPRLMFEPVAGENGWGPRLRSAADITGRKAPARLWAMGDDRDGWMPNGDLTLLYGPGGAGKTTLVGQLALAFARGEPVWGVPMRRMPVMLIDCEDSEDELHRRFEQQGIRASDQVFFASFVGEDAGLHPPFRRGESLKSDDMTPFYQFLDYHLGQMGPGEKMVFLDNLGQIYEGDYMDTPQIRTFINFYCRRLFAKHNATGAILAHPSDTQKLTGEGGFGGIAWSANVRSRLYFDYIRDARGKPIDGKTRELIRKKGNYTSEGVGIPLAWDNWSFVKTERPAAPARPARTKPAEPTETISILVQKAMMAYLDARPGLERKEMAFADDIYTEMGRDGHEFTDAEAIRGHLRRIRASDVAAAEYWCVHSKVWRRPPLKKEG